MKVETLCLSSSVKGLPVSCTQSQFRNVLDSPKHCDNWALCSHGYVSSKISTGGHQSRAPWKETVQTILSAGSREWFLPNSIPNPSFSGPPLDMLPNQLPSQDLQGGPAGRAREGRTPGVSCLPAFPKPQRGVHRGHEVFTPKAVSPLILRNLSIDKLV